MAVKVTFDTANKLIVCKPNTTELDVMVDLYSDAKEDWIADNELNKFKFPFTAVGGNPIDEDNGVYVTSYYFLQYGWRIRPQENNHTLKVGGGILLTIEGDDPFVATQGYYNVQVKYSQPIKSETIVKGSGMSQSEHDKLMDLPSETENADAVLDDLLVNHSIEGSVGHTLNKVNTDNQYLLGLGRKNFRLFDQQYQTFGGINKLTSGKVRIYANALDCELDLNPLFELQITASYDTNGNMIGYKSVDA